jgi:hypothetical protein
VFPSGPDNPGKHSMIYGGFEIQSFEAESGLWQSSAELRQ